MLTIATRLGVPPFALRPASLTRQPSQPTTTIPGTSPSQRNTQVPAPSDHFSISPLNSSSSSDESFLNLGAVPDTLDPFSRFWGMLENMLDDISNPVAFASAPLGIPHDVPAVPEPLSKQSPAEREKQKTRSRKEEKAKASGESQSIHLILVNLIKDRARDISPAESFYLVQSSRQNTSSRQASPIPHSPPPTASKANVNGKTPEELALENLNLRTSLDTIASHAEKMERDNKVLREQGEEREKAMRNIAIGVRREVRCNC
jgi:hypothetical protein